MLSMPARDPRYLETFGTHCTLVRRLHHPYLNNTDDIVAPYGVQAAGRLAERQLERGDLYSRKELRDWGSEWRNRVFRLCELDTRTVVVSALDLRPQRPLHNNVVPITGGHQNGLNMSSCKFCPAFKLTCPSGHWSVLLHIRIALVLLGGRPCGACSYSLLVGPQRPGCPAAEASLPNKQDAPRPRLRCGRDSSL